MPWTSHYLASLEPSTTGQCYAFDGRPSRPKPPSLKVGRPSPAHRGALFHRHQAVIFGIARLAARAPYVSILAATSEPAAGEMKSAPPTRRRANKLTRLMVYLLMVPDEPFCMLPFCMPLPF